MKRLHTLIPVVVLAILLAASLVIAGCGDDEAATTTTAAATATTAGGTATTAPAGDAIVLRLPMGQPDGDPLVTPIQKMAERFNARAGGKYVIQVFPGGSLVAVPEALDACRTGTVEMGSICYPIYSSIDERLCALELPFICNNINALAASQNPEMAALYDTIMSTKFNQKVLGINHCGFNEVIGTKPIKVLADWKGTLVGVSAPVAIDMMQGLGAETVVVDWTEAYSNLDKKVVDCIVAGTTYMWIAELYKPGKYSTWMSATAANYGVDINLDVWNAMPADIQQILVEEVQAACAEENQVHIDIVQPNYQKLVDNGCQVFKIEGAERDAWKAKLASYVADKIASFGDFGTQFMAIIDAANAANP